MFLAKIKPHSQHLRIRFLIYFFLVFTFSVVATLVAIYYFMSSSLIKKDHELIQSKFHEMSLLYKEEGIKGLSNFDNNWAYLRLEDINGKTIFLHNPAKDDSYQLSRLENTHDQQTRGEKWIVLKQSKDDDDTLEILSGVLPDGKILQIGKDSDDRGDHLDLFRSIVFAISLVTVFLGLAAGIILSQGALKPVRDLVKTLRQVNQGKMSARVELPHAHDELYELSLLFNEMLERIEKLVVGMKQTVDNVAHDLKTPLTQFRTLAERTLSSKSNTEEYQNALLECVESSDKILSIINAIMDVSQAETGTMKLSKQNISPTQLIDEVCELYEYVAENENVTLHTHCDCPEVICVDINQMRRALANLLDNAIKYHRPQGEVWINGNCQDNYFLLEIRDNGIGISEEDLPKIFTRLFRADQSRSKKGLGLGLTLVKAIVEAHGGHMTVSSKLNEGSIFTVYIPK